MRARIRTKLRSSSKASIHNRQRNYESVGVEQIELDIAWKVDVIPTKGRVSVFATRILDRKTYTYIKFWFVY